jgi:hypothetical protein
LSNMMQQLGGATTAAAAALAAGGGPWTQQAAGHLLSAVTRLASWPLTDTAADHGISSRRIQQQVTALLAEGGPVQRALSAASTALDRQLQRHPVSLATIQAGAARP